MFARRCPGLTRCKVRTPAPPGIAGITCSRAGRTELGWKSTPPASSPLTAMSCAITPTRPVLARTFTAIEPAVSIRSASETVREPFAGMVRPDAPAAVTGPSSP